MKFNLLKTIGVIFFSMVTPLLAVDSISKPTKIEVSIPFTISPTGHQIVVLKHGDKDVRMILDSAAGANVLSLKAAYKLQLELKDSTETASGIGTKEHAMTSLSPLKVSYAEHDFMLNNLVAMDLTHVEIAGGEEGADGLLGSPFFRANKAKIDFKTNLLTFTLKPNKTHNK